MLPYNNEFQANHYIISTFHILPDFPGFLNHTLYNKENTRSTQWSAVIYFMKQNEINIFTKIFKKC